MVESNPIPFPAPGTTANASASRSRRTAAHNAASAIKNSSSPSKLQSKETDESDELSLSEEEGSSEHSAASWVEGNTGVQEKSVVEDEFEDASKGEPTTDEEVYSKKTPKKKTPVKRKRATNESAVKKETDGDSPGVASVDYAPNGQTKTDEDGTPAKKPKTARKPRAKKGSSAKKENENDSDVLTELDDLEEKPKKQRKPRKPREPKPEPVYVIPDVEKLPNPGFQGRLGYACLNTILRNLKKPKDPIFCSRTCRIDSIKKNGMGFLKDLGKQNMRDLCELIQWNEDNNIRFMRLSSEMFPFAAHGTYGYDLSYAEEELKSAGDLAKKYGHRLTTHPGQFTQLGSPRNEVVKNAFMDLKYHCEMLDRMGLDQDSVMIIHGGGIFGDKEATIERLKENWKKLPDNVKARLVLENDEICYNVDDLLPICEELGIPLVLDYHHHNLNPTAEQTLEELMPRILATWTNKGIRPKFHLSEPRLGAVTLMERRAHSDRCKHLPTPLPSDIDLMIEAKDKEQAVMQLFRIYDLQPVKHESLRPPVEVESLRTGGRKSHKKKKSQDGVEEGGLEEEALEDPEAVASVDLATAGKAQDTEVMKADLEVNEHNHEHILNGDGDVVCKPKHEQPSQTAVTGPLDPKDVNKSARNVKASPKVKNLMGTEVAPKKTARKGPKSRVKGAILEDVSDDE